MKFLLKKNAFHFLCFIKSLVVFVAISAQAQTTSIFTDTSLTAKTVTAYGTATVVPAQSKFSGPVGTFNGTTDYLKVSPSPLDGNPTSFTIEAWIYITSISANGWPVVSQSANGTTGEQQLFVSGSNDGAANQNKLRFSRGANATTPVDLIGSTTLPLNQWVHVALSVDGTTAKLFVNGNLDASIPLTTGWVDTSQNFYVATTLNTSAPQNQSFANGKISDLRITKNSGRYKNSFKPISVEVIDDTQAYDEEWYNSVLILKADKKMGTGIFDESASLKVVDVNGSAQISTAQAKYGAGSIYFNGNTDYLSIPSSPDFQFGSDDFTIETWVNFEHVPKAGEYAAIVGNRDSYVSNNQFTIFYGGTEKFHFYYSVNGNSQTISTSNNKPEVVANTWYHIALVRTQGTISLYINGSLAASANVGSSKLYASTADLYLGAVATPSLSYYLKGFMDDVRIIKGIAKYKNNFIPAEIPPTPKRIGDHYWSLVSLLLNAGDGENIVDKSIINKSITTYGNAQINNLNPKFGEGSIYFNGNGSYLSLSAHSDFKFRKNDFTIEAWVNFENVPKAGDYAAIIGNRNSYLSNNQFTIFYGDTEKFHFYYSINGGSQVISTYNNQPEIVANTWYHIAFVRNKDIISLYINGSLAASANVGSSVLYPSTANLFIGAITNPFMNYYFKGFIDDVRITKGVARYTGDYIPPIMQLEPARFIKDPYSNRVSLLLLSGATATDNVPPYVTSFTKQTNTNFALDNVTLNFSKDMEPASFTSEQFDITDASQNRVLISSITKISDTSYKLIFAPALLAGTYNLKVLPSLLGEDGLPLDQNKNGVGGEVQDAFEASINVSYAAPLNATSMIDPQGLGNGTSINISWPSYTKAVNGRDISKFRVYISTTPYTNVAQATKAQEVTGTSATVTGLLANTTYYVSVVAVDSSGAFSSTVTPVAVKSLAATEQSTSYTYNTAGQILTEDGPRIDVNDITTYTYDTAGNRATLTNALSQMIRYNTYDGVGRLLSVTDTNGITTEFTYSDRGWLLTSRVKHPTTSTLDSITTYTYDAVGQMTSMTLPNGYVISYEYDDARRLKAINNAAGERIEYTLDLAGNRTQQIIKNNANTIVYSVAQAFDELSRVMSVTGNHNQNQKHQYDANDNDVSMTDGRNNTTQQTYDALNRVAKIIDPALKETQFTYDAQNRIKTVTDARGNITTYNYDGFGNLLSQVSPDTGTTTFSYDTAGNRTSAKDARGVVVNYSYDALNRLTSVSYPASPADNITYTYDSTANGSYGVGRLSSITTSNSSITYTYNHLGLITQKRTTYGSITVSVSYTYDVAGNLSSITYPSGRIVTYLRDSAGRIQSMSTKENATAAAQSVVSNVSYMPFGPASSYLFGNGLSHLMSFDSDYRINAIQVGGVLSRNYTYDNADNIAGISDAIATTKSQTFTYDNLDRLTSANGVYGYQAFSYDAVGNRTGFLADNGSGILSDTYNYDTASNRLTSINKTTAGVASGTRNFGYDAAGNTTTFTSDSNVNETLAYNNAGRLTTVKNGSTTLATYSYNALGQRISKTAGTTQELYVYDEAGQLIAVTNAAGQTQREYIYRDGQLASFVTLKGGPISAITFTANTAVLQNAAYSKVQTGYNSSSGYIQFNGEGQFTWTANIISPATYAFYVRYSLVGTNRPLAILVDGVQAATMNFNPTADWNTWTTTPVNLTLTAGSHSITLKTTGNSGPNIDQAALQAGGGQTGIPVPTLYYSHNDHNGTPQIVTNQSKAVVWAADYQAFGKVNVTTNTLEIYSRFPGQVSDSETGLYQNWHRDYDPSIGRYIESDPIGLAGGINPYAYVFNDPFGHIDPNGLFPVYGWWCGGGWTGGHFEAYTPHPEGYYKTPINGLDQSCKVHDMCYNDCRTNNPCDKSQRSACFLRCDGVLSGAAHSSGGLFGTVIGKAMDRSGERDSEKNPSGCGCDEPPAPPPIPPSKWPTYDQMVK